MKGRIHILTCFLWKLLSNRDLMDPHTRMPVAQIWEFFENSKEVRYFFTQYAKEGIVSGAKAKISSWITMGAAQTNIFGNNTKTDTAKYKTELDEFRKKYGVMCDKIKELKEYAKKLSKPLPELPKSVLPDPTGLTQRLSQLSEGLSSRDSKLRQNISDHIIQPLTVASVSHQGAIERPRERVLRSLDPTQ